MSQYYSLIKTLLTSKQVLPFLEKLGHVMVTWSPTGMIQIEDGNRHTDCTIKHQEVSIPDPIIHSQVPLHSCGPGLRSVDGYLGM